MRARRSATSIRCTVVAPERLRWVTAKAYRHDADAPARGVPSSGQEVPAVTVWFTVKLDDRPGSLARVANALGDAGVNITGIVGVAEDTDGALMLTTSDPAATRQAFTTLGLAFEEHDPTGGVEPGALSVNDLRP